jgi:predicted transcriptional regulator
MTAKEQLRERIESLTEQEAERTLRLLDDVRDPLAELLDGAPLDDEPVTPEEAAAIAEAEADIAAGRTVPLEEILRESE